MAQKLSDSRYIISFFLTLKRCQTAPQNLIATVQIELPQDDWYAVLDKIVSKSAIWWQFIICVYYIPNLQNMKRQK